MFTNCSFIAAQSPHDRSTMLQNVAKCCTIAAQSQHSRSGIRSKIFCIFKDRSTIAARSQHNVVKCCEMLRNVVKCCEMLWNVVKCCEIAASWKLQQELPQEYQNFTCDARCRTLLQSELFKIIHRNIQSVGATGGVHKGQGRNQCKLTTCAY